MSALEAEPATREVRRLGEYETIWELPEFYMTLPQIRNDINPILPDLIDSIRNGDLLNHIDVARMTEDTLTSYINFVNRTWKADISIEDYPDKLQDDGFYYLVIAGHTRHEAVTQLNNENDGPDYLLPAKIHLVSTPSEIIDRQTAENLHSTPKQEQQAIAVVEQYLFGLEDGSWSNKADYIKKKEGKVSRKMLNDALGFADLSSEIRDFVFSRHLSYSVAIELGRSSDVLADYVKVNMGDYIETEAQRKEFAEVFNKEMSIMIHNITGKDGRKLNVTAAKKYIQGKAMSMQDQINKMREVDEDSLFDHSMVSSTDQSTAYVKRIRAEHDRAVREMAAASVETVDLVISLHKRLAGNEPSDTLVELNEERTRRKERLAKHVTPRLVAVNV